MAEQIVHAAHLSSWEYWIGLGTTLVILANMLAPGVLDRYLARTAYEGQARRAAVSASRQDSLFRPVKRFHRVHGQ
jgi:hypothetical protein